MPYVTGGTTTNQQKATALREQLDREVARIRANENLSDIGRRAEMAKYWAATAEKVDALAQAEQDEADRAQLKLERDLFGLAGNADPSAAISMRDAMDRAGKVTSAGEASQLLHRARLTGDQHLAKAVLSTAVELDFANVVDEYAVAFPEHAARVQDLLAVQSSSVGQKFASDVGRVFTYEAAKGKPVELERLNDWQIRQLIDQPDEVPPAPVQPDWAASNFGEAQQW